MGARLDAAKSWPLNDTFRVLLQCMNTVFARALGNVKNYRG